MRREGLRSERAPRRRPDPAAACVARASLALVVLLSVGCAPADVPRDVVLVSIDTLRADRLGCYGREDAGTPHLDRLARRGVRFADATAPAPITLPSHASLLTGLDPSHHGVRHNGLFALDADFTTLAELLRGAGFRTGAFVGSIVLRAQHGLAQGFERYSDPQNPRLSGLFQLGERRAPEVNRDALAWIDAREPEERVFLFVHYMEPHAPWAPPEPERTRFAPDFYQGEVATVDRALGDLLAGLAARDRLRRALVIVVADHGESIGDHGEWTHGIFLYQSTLHVPLLFAGPGVGTGRVVATPVGLVDVLPSVLDAVGLPLPASLDGRSLLPALRGEALSERDLYAESHLPRLDYGWSALRALRRGPQKYIEAPRPELYALDRDPAETENRLRAQPEDAAALREALAARSAGPATEAPRVELTAEEREALADLGYLAGAHEGGGDAGRPDPKDRIADAAALDHASRLVQDGELAPARELLEGLVRERPTMLDARLRLVTTLALQGEGDAAIREAEGLVAAAATIPRGDRVGARAQNIIGDLHAAAGRYEAAARAYEASLAVPQSPAVLAALAEVYRELGRDADAERLLREGAPLNPAPSSPTPPRGPAAGR